MLSSEVRIGEEIGRSAELRTCRGRLEDGRSVLVKLALGGNDRADELLEREYEICLDRALEGVPKALGRIEHGGRPALVLEDVPGLALDRAIGSGLLPMAEALDIGTRLGTLLSALHRRDWIHRDLRPAHVLYDPQSREVHLTGLGRAERVSPEIWSLPAPETPEGDPTYLAPEATGRLARRLDYRADLYSLGVMLFELLTGRPPYTDADSMARIHAHLAREPPDAGRLRPGLPTMVSRILDKLLAKTAEERYRSGLGVAHDLRRCLDALETSDETSDEAVGEGDAFELGEGDVAERFELPQTLIGREAELEWLQEALAPDPRVGGPRTARSRTIVRLVAGFSGVGKTALIDTLRTSAFDRRELFAGGRHDPDRAVPYGAILGALGSLVRQQLGASADQLQAFEQRLAGALGTRLGVLTDALPDLANLFGDVPPVPPIEPANARRRFHGCVVTLLSSFTAPRTDAEGGSGSRLVLFLDDLQWIDPATGELLPHLAEVEGLLLLGAYRDNEVGDDHPLRHALAELRAHGADVDTVSLAPLGEDALGRLISDALSAPAAPLAELVYRKTAGNPFFARTFLLTIHQRGLLRLTDPEPGSLPHWTWDLDAIAALEATENAVELVAQRLAGLTPAVRQTLALAAVFGKEVHTSVLKTLCEGEEEGLPSPEGGISTEAILLEACREGFLTELDSPEGDAPDRYAFVHDRLREGAIALLSREELAAAHLRISRLLRQRLSDGETVGGVLVDLFEISEHSSHVAHLVSDPEERRELVLAHQEAGRRARVAGAFPAAFTAHRRALELAQQQEGDPWQQSYELTYPLYIGAAETACLAGNFEEAERLENVILRQARSLLDQVPAEEMRAYRLFSQHRAEAAVKLQLDVLGRLGMSIPTDPSAADLWPAVLAADRAVATVQAAVEERGVRRLPRMRDPEKKAIARLLARTAMQAGWSRHTLARMIMCRLVELTVAEGVHPTSPMAYALLADVRHGELGDLAGARQVGELGLELLKHPAATADRSACRFVYDVAVGPLTEHPAALLERFRKTHGEAMSGGDLLVAGGAAYHTAVTGFFAGTPLEDVRAAAEAHREVFRGVGQQIVAQMVHGVGRLAGVLLGNETIEEATLGIHGDVPPEAASSIRVRLVGIELAIRLLLRHPEAPALARECLAMPRGTLPIIPFDFLCCLAFLEAAARAGDPEPLEVPPCFERLQARAAEAPEVYDHKLDLVLAHRHRLEGRRSQAIEACDRAIEGARRNHFPHEEALAHELAAELRLEEDGAPGGVAATHFGEALGLYRQWRAAAKVEQLEERFPALIPTPTEATPSSLDVDSLEQAGQALASELDLARFLRRLAALLLRNAGAQRAFLVRSDPRGPTLEVRAESTRPGEAPAQDGSGDSEPRVELLDELLPDESAELAATVVRFVARTLETVVVDDARHDPRFPADPYLERVRPRSILCLPLLHRGEALTIVYLENRTSPNVFSAERSGAVRLLATQATAALENARLHDSLKREVETRRRAEAELRQALDEVAELKNRLEAENVYLQEEIRSHFEEIVGTSDAIRKVLYKVEQVAATDATVLVFGETGTGKELVARALHRLSVRRERPLVKVNCAALPATLIESELFGHEKGAFTGALGRKTGRFELADSGTLFLDEIGELPLDLQAKLLRVLQEGELERLGSTKTIRVDVRVVAATNRDLEQAMSDGTFRPDLYYRLTVFPIALPPLRERHGDLAQLVRFFVERKGAPIGSRVKKIPRRVMERLEGYGWPGNVRELENVIERALILSPGDTLCLEDGFGGGTASADQRPMLRLDEVEKAHISSVLEACEWKIKGSGNAAEQLGLPPATLRDRMKKLGIVRPTAEKRPTR